MRTALQCSLLLALGISPWATATDIPAGAPIDLSVTVYRSPHGPSLGTGSSFDLDELQGFALISQTHTISIPAGVSRLRFEGVADGIESATAILTGLPFGIIEKNRDARVLSPAELVASALGRNVELVRTNKRTGIATHVVGSIRSDASAGVVFESADGVEALRCSGLPETFSFSGGTDLASTPTLSVVLRSPTPLHATVTLSYLAHAFDWSASYVATLSDDERTMDLGAWVTLANGNAVTFPSAHAQVVAGRINRESNEVEAVENDPMIMAQCWPNQTTSDLPAQMQEILVTATRRRDAMEGAPRALPQAAMLSAAVSKLVQQEQLGDLKLYRVPDRTNLASRQMKQVRLLDRSQVPVDLYYAAELAANQTIPLVAARRMLRTTNDEAHHLGVPLPSGRVDTSIARGDTALLLSETPVRDVAVDEQLEVFLGDSPDVQISATTERISIDTAAAKDIPLLPDIVHLRAATVDTASRIDFQNATAKAATIELRLRLQDGMQLIAADTTPADSTGRPLFKITVPAGGSASIHYQTEHTSMTRQVH